MKKKFVACLLTAAMTMSLAACGGGNGSNPASSGGGSSSSGGGDKLTVSNETEDVEIDGITYHKAKDMTKDNITLTFYHYMDKATVEYLADRFEKIYPNITVVPAMDTEGKGYFESLSALFTNGQAPDVIQYTDADTALVNRYLYDMTDLWNSDKETEELPDTIKDKEHGFGTFDTGHRFAAPAKFYPGIMFADRNVLKKLNQKVPDQTWTWDQMIKIIKDCTKKQGGVQYFGLGAYNRLDSYYGIASSQNVLGEFGFDGKQFNLSAWANGEQEFADLKNQGYVAPTGVETMDAFGEENKWFGQTGQVALFSEAFWTFQNIWTTDAAKEWNLDIIPYVIPAVSQEDASAEHHSIATIDGGGICAGTKHPREAYELMKFMFWGRDGWLTRIQLYEQHATDYTSEGGIVTGGKDENGNALPEMKHHDMFCPITTNEEVWDAYLKIYCEGMDDEHANLWKNYFQSCMHPISFGWENIAGYWNACNEYFNAIKKDGRIGIHEIVDHGAGKPADYIDEATTKFNWYHAKAMQEYFGPNGYNVLTDEQCKEYADMQAANESAAPSTEAAQ